MDDEDETVTLLLKALDGLPTEEREQVLRMLVRRGLTAPVAPTWVTLGSSAPGTTGFVASRGGEQQMVPVRFPTEEHARLRGWCTDNRTPMAVVVRGLVAEFLDRQHASAPPARSGVL